MKRLVALSLILLVLSCSAFALAPLKGTSSKGQESVVEASTNSTISSMTEQKATTTESKTSSTASEADYEALLKSFEDKGYFVTKSTLNELEEGVKNLYQDYLTKAALADAYKSETVKTRLFADLGVAFGFKGDSLLYGLTGDMGLKFGQGLMFKTGATYMVGSFSDIKDFSWSLDKLTLTATVGWEW